MSRLLPVLFLTLAACTPAEPPLLIDHSDGSQPRAEESAETGDAQS